LTPEELHRVEDLVNGWILQAQPTAITEDREFAEAVEAGAMALFGEKYGDSVRTVEVAHLRLGGDEGEQLTSLELCGGCHVENTGEIGLLLITAERGVASGVRRIEAVTGEGAQRLVRHQREVLDQVAGSLGVESERAPTEIDAWRRKTRALEKELADLRMRLISGAESSGELQVEGIKIIAREVPPAPVNEIRNMADVLRQKMGSGVVVLASREGEKVLIVSSVTADLTDRVHAGRLASAVASVVGGAGGGRPDFAQAGGKEPAKLPAALERVGEFVQQQIDSA
jgi:alanyl-tRNA synthetase